MLPELIKFSIEPDILNEIRLVAEDVRETLVNITLKTKWIEDETARRNITEVLKRIKVELGCPRDMLNSTRATQFYRKFMINHASLTKNILAANKVIFNFYQSLYRDNEEEFQELIDLINIIEILKSNAWYLGRMIFLHPLYLNRNLITNDGWKYGDLAATIGHEFSHLFGFSGLKNYSGCIERQYKCAKSTKDDIADNIGFLAAYKTYLSVLERSVSNAGDNIEKRKLFWKHLASSWCSSNKYTDCMSHSPPDKRVDFTLQNYPEFSRDFECKLDTAMNPKNKCEFDGFPSNGLSLIKIESYES